MPALVTIGLDEHEHELTQWRGPDRLTLRLDHALAHRFNNER